MTIEAIVSNTERPIFQLDLSSENRTFSPRSVEELDYWLQKEERAWGWLHDAKADDTGIDYILNYVFLHRKHIRRTVDGIASIPPEQRAEQYRHLTTMLSERYAKNRVPTSESPLAQFVFKLAERDKVVAAHALWALLSNDPQGSNRPSRALRGQVLAAQYMNEAGVLQAAQASAWAELYKKISAEHDALRKEAGTISDTYRKILEDVESLHKEQRGAFDEVQAARGIEFKKLTDAHAGDMRNIEATFKRELSLRSAVDYLRDKAEQHKSAARTAAVAAAVVGLLFVGLAIYIAATVLTEDGNPPVPQIAVAVLTATLVFWVLRILVRVLLSNLHLETDMRARSTFVHTYLALLAEGGGIKDEDRALVIGLVFRPISDGLVRDDATPPGLWDLLTKNLSGRS